MKFTLKDYQEDAVRRVLSNLGKASRRWHQEDEKSSFALSAVTGAGKTVMAASVLEALFHGSEEFELDPDPTATVIWFSDDPSLNEQSRSRVMGASDRLPYKDLIRVEHPFSQPRFEPGKVYFLNTQKLGANSLLVRGHNPSDNGTDPHPHISLKPDSQAHTLWDTIKNTIEDERRTLILLLDEAHRGLGSQTDSARAERQTIVSRLINGHAGIPGIPVVLGISATVERFSKAMSQATDRTRIPDVTVDPNLVQASGLLKDTTILEVPDEVGQFDSVLLKRATENLMRSTEAWAEYAQQQADSDPVKPLMVFQVPNKPKPADIANSISTILSTYPELDASQIRHVFGTRETEQFGPYAVSHIEPERVQDATNVRVLISKTAISTGWDCPRAEVLVSFRPSNDGTSIRQLIGRMVRTPLARRIPGNELLNSVHCYLPFFDTQTVDAVAEELRVGKFGVGDEGEGASHRVVVNGIELGRNQDVPLDVWEKFKTLPSQTRPKANARPLRRLSELAHTLSYDEVRVGAVAEAKREIHRVLDAAAVRFQDAIQEARTSVMTVEGVTFTVDLKRQQKSLEQFVAEADVTVIAEAYRRAVRVLGGDFAHSYADHLADSMVDPPDEDDALLSARVEIAAMGMVPQVREYLDEEADKLTQRWLDEHRVAILKLTDDREDAYRKIREQSSQVETVTLSLPRAGIGKPSTFVDGVEVPNPQYSLHLLSDSKGMYPLDPDSSWELDVLEAEQSRAGFLAWFRNPGRNAPESLAVAYEEGDTKLVRPDFLFFSLLDDGTVGASIVDPHGFHQGDSLPKLEGLAKYAEQFGSHFHRIEAVAKVDGEMRGLDLLDKATRDSIADARKTGSPVDSLYLGKTSFRYA